MKIKQLFFILLFLINSAQAGFAGVRLLGALGIAAVGSKVSQTFYKNKVLKKQEIFIFKQQKFQDLKESFGHNWQGNWEYFPNMAERVKQVLQKHNLQPKDFDLEIEIGHRYTIQHSASYKNKFSFDIVHLAKAEYYFQNNGGNYQQKNWETVRQIVSSFGVSLVVTQRTVNSFLGCFKHELQHYFDRDLIVSLNQEIIGKIVEKKYKNFWWMFFKKKNKTLSQDEFDNGKIALLKSDASIQQRLHKLEFRADLLSQDNPQEMRDFAEFIVSNGSDNQKLITHPDNQIRYDNLIKKAEQLEKEQKEQEFKRAQEQKQFEERFLMVP